MNSAWKQQQVMIDKINDTCFIENSGHYQIVHIFLFESSESIQSVKMVTKVAVVKDCMSRQ